MSAKYAEIAKKNYPDNWNIEMLKNLVKIKKLTKEEYHDITGQDY